MEKTNMYSIILTSKRWCVYNFQQIFSEKYIYCLKRPWGQTVNSREIIDFTRNHNFFLQANLVFTAVMQIYLNKVRMSFALKTAIE